MDKFLQIGIWISIFITGVVFKVPFDFYLYYFFFFGGYPYLLSRYGLSKRMLLILGSFLVIGFVFVITGDNKPFNLIKVWFGVFLSYSFYYMYLKHIKFQTFQVMEMYLKGSYVAGIVAVSQQIFYKLHFPLGYNYNIFLLGYKWGNLNDMEPVMGLGRAGSLISEPSSYAMVVAPAVFIVICSLIYKDLRIDFLKKHHKFFIVFGYILSMSSTAFLGFGVMALLLLINTASFRQVVLSFALLIGLGYGALNYNEAFYKRFNAINKLMSVDISKLINKNTGIISNEVYNSSFILYANYDVAYKNFKKHPITGTGMGSHPIAFEKYSFFKLLRDEYKNNMNNQDANSLFNRLMSETGLIGLSVFFFIIFRFYLRKNKKIQDPRYWLYNNAILVIIVLFLIRQGNYFFTGFPLFVWMYYFNWKNLQNERKKQAQLSPIAAPVSPTEEDIDNDTKEN
ncbi:MAG: O-antigen ligase family protein [Bacteroidia bacterium]